MDALAKQLRNLTGVSAPQPRGGREEGGDPPLSLTLCDGLKQTWSKEDGKWVSDMNDMQRAAETITSLTKVLEERDSELQRVKSELEQHKSHEMDIVRRNEKLNRLCEEKNQELLQCYASIAELKLFLTSSKSSN